jgi:glycogen(starch) synthase
MSPSWPQVRAAVLSSEYPPQVFGGLGVHVDRLTAAMSETVHCDVFVPTGATYLPSASSVSIREVAVNGASSNEEYWFRYCRAVVELVRISSYCCDLIHAHDWMTILAGVRLRDLLRRPLVFHIHLPQVAGPALAAEEVGLLCSDMVLVNSTSVRLDIEHRALPLNRLEVLPNGVDLDRFRPAADWPADDGYLLFVGRLAVQKGVDTLLRAFEVVLHRCADQRLVIVGDGELELYLKNIARYLGFPDRVTFAGWQTGEELARLYQRARIVVVPSNYEPFGIVALEAMACGRPVVASRVGGLEETIEDGVQGYLVPPADRVLLAERLMRLILDDDKRCAMGRAARLRAEQYSWSRVAAATAHLYSELMAAGPAGSSPAAVERTHRRLLRKFEPRFHRLVSELLPQAPLATRTSE